VSGRNGAPGKSLRVHADWVLRDCRPHDSR